MDPTTKRVKLTGSKQKNMDDFTSRHLSSTTVDIGQLSLKSPEFIIRQEEPITGSTYHCKASLGEMEAPKDFHKQVEERFRQVPYFFIYPVVS